MAKPKAEYRLTVLVVEGISRFPIDMLRYDNCAPATGADASEMERDRQLSPGGATRRVKLRRFSYDASKATADRWQSFGWRVVEDSGT